MIGSTASRISRLLGGTPFSDHLVGDLGDGLPIVVPAAVLNDLVGMVANSLQSESVRCRWRSSTFLARLPDCLDAASDFSPIVRVRRVVGSQMPFNEDPFFCRRVLSHS